MTQLVDYGEQASLEQDTKMRSTEFTYVYLLRSKLNPEQIYTGYTTDLEQRLKDHNRGHVHHTAKYAPWQIEAAVAFRDKTKAQAFEKYLKSGSGREFARRHF
ncbi:MAG: GIY-YIG nuclease family protein [Kiritimatiellia bacterium]